MDKESHISIHTYLNRLPYIPTMGLFTVRIPLPSLLPLSSSIPYILHLISAHTLTLPLSTRPENPLHFSRAETTPAPHLPTVFTSPKTNWSKSALCSAPSKVHTSGRPSRSSALLFLFSKSSRMSSTASERYMLRLGYVYLE